MKSLFKSRKAPTALPTDPSLIDVKRLIAEISDDELLRSADAYFAKLTPDSVQYKKPFFDPAGAAQLNQHLGLLFEAADLFRGARVVDFGCGTGWLSLGLAQMGCDAVGVDISPAALKLAERLKLTRRTPSDGRMEFHAYDGVRLPLPDASVDRIVSFDSFHHVKDQAATLREFARVLKDGGRVALVEPGPHHSRTAQSQQEMANFKVIENDVCMDEVAAHARACGLGEPQMLVQWQRPLHLGLAEFNAWARKGVPKVQALKLARQLARQLTDAQYFYLPKGKPVLDSRQATSLGGEIRLLALQPATLAGFPAFKVTLAARNTGQGAWLTATDEPGQVKLGCQLYAADGTLVNLDYARLPLEGEPVPVGEERTVSAVMRLPSLPSYQLKFDLVAEQVAWFAGLGRAKPVELSSDALSARLAGRA